MASQNVIESSDIGRPLASIRDRIVRELHKIASQRRARGEPPLKQEELGPLISAAACVAADQSMMHLLMHVQQLARSREHAGLPPLGLADLRPLVMAGNPDVNQEEVAVMAAALRQMASDREANGLPPLSSASGLAPLLLVTVSAIPKTQLQAAVESTGQPGQIYEFESIDKFDEDSEEKMDTKSNADVVTTKVSPKSRRPARNRGSLSSAIDEEMERELEEFEKAMAKRRQLPPRKSVILEPSYAKSK